MELSFHLELEVMTVKKKTGFWIIGGAILFCFLCVTPLALVLILNPESIRSIALEFRSSDSTRPALNNSENNKVPKALRRHFNPTDTIYRIDYGRRWNETSKSYDDDPTTELYFSTRGFAVVLKEDGGKEIFDGRTVMDRDQETGTRLDTEYSNTYHTSELTETGNGFRLTLVRTRNAKNLIQHNRLEIEIEGDLATIKISSNVDPNSPIFKKYGKTPDASIHSSTIQGTVTLVQSATPTNGTSQDLLTASSVSEGNDAAIKKLLESSETEADATKRIRDSAKNQLPKLRQLIVASRMMNFFAERTPYWEAQRDASQIQRSPPVLEVLQNPDLIQKDLKISAAPEIFRQFEGCNRDISNTQSLLTSQINRKQTAEGELARTEQDLRAELAQLEASFSKYPAMSQQVKKQQRERQQSRADNITASLKGEITGLTQQIASSREELRRLRELRPVLERQVKESIAKNTWTYVQEINRLGEIAHAAGLPNELAQYQSQYAELGGEIIKLLKHYREQTVQQGVINAPPTPSTRGLTHVGGFTHIVNGSQYIIENKIVSIPDKYRSMFSDGEVGPNEVAIDGYFRFTGNSTGTNRLGAAINVELYECDEVYAEAYKLQLRYQNETHKLLQLFGPIENYQLSNNIAPILEMFENLVGKKAVAEILQDSESEFKHLIESRPKFVAIAQPPETAGAATSDDSNTSKQSPIVGVEHPATIAPNEDLTATPAETTPSTGLVIGSQKHIYNLIHLDPVGQNLRWISVDVEESKKLISEGYWQANGEIGFGIVTSEERNTWPLWRMQRGPDNRFQYVLGKIDDNKMKPSGLLAFVWRTRVPGMIEIFALDNGSTMQLVSELEKRDDGKRKRDWLVEEARWTERFSFFVYPVEE